MKLEALLPVLCDSAEDRARYAEHRNLDITAVVNDSRAVIPGSLFIALRGTRTDGHRFIPNALRAGAVAILSERRVALPADAVHFVVRDARRRMAALASVFAGAPTARLHVTGITGTNGKTTTAFRTRRVLETAGHPTGLIGTIAYRIGERCLPAKNTTPDSVALQDLFAQMVETGLTHAVIEVSSHALELHRVAEVQFDTAVFTGLSDHEHLDFHGTFDRYRRAKARLFEMLPPDGTAVLNADDPAGRYMAERAGRAAKLWFGVHNSADVMADVRSMDMTGTTYRLCTPDGSAEVRTTFIGEFNVLNDLAAAAAACAAGVGLDRIVEGLERPDPVPGRLEPVPAPGFFPLVDYAHNEGALSSVLRTVRRLAPKRLLVVFGCGGDRDPSKRPAMGAVAEKYCDLIFLTADNSRSEDPERIIAAIELGMTGVRPRHVIPDRETAIRAAVAAARPGDVLLVAGKGHETYQILGPNTTVPFDDREVLRRAIAERHAARTPVPTTELKPEA